MNAVPLTETPKTETPTKAPTIFSQPGVPAGRREALQRVFQAGRTWVLHYPWPVRLSSFIECPIKDDPELRDQWQAGALSVPKGGHKAFASGRRNGLLGRQGKRPEGPLGDIWDEGQEEGLLVAEKQSPENLSYGRGFRCGIDRIPTTKGPILSEWERGHRVAIGFVMEEALNNQKPEPEEPLPTDNKTQWAFRIGAKMAETMPAKELRCPFPDQQLEEAWLRGVESVPTRSR